jgi:hypothetical protein
MEKGVQRAQLATLTGCNLETIRYYEKVGLLPAPAQRKRLPGLSARSRSSVAVYPARTGFGVFHGGNTLAPVAH